MSASVVVFNILLWPSTPGNTFIVADDFQKRLLQNEADMHQDDDHDDDDDGDFLV
jgi:hypothetical protein